jgi:hypothetical protein
MDKGTKVGLITFSVFMTEAIIHYNLGVNKGKDKKGFVIPPTMDIVKLGLVVGAFSLLNGVLINKFTT